MNQSANLDLAKWRFGNDMKQKLKKKTINQVQNKNRAQPSFAQLTTFLTLVIVKYGKEPQYKKKPHYSKHILPVSWPFVILRFICSLIQLAQTSSLIFLCASTKFLIRETRLLQLFKVQLLFYKRRNKI